MEKSESEQKDERNDRGGISRGNRTEKSFCWTLSQLNDRDTFSAHQLPISPEKNPSEHCEQLKLLRIIDFHPRKWAETATGYR